MSSSSGGAGLKVFAGIVSGVSISLVVCSLLYLAWFIPLGRPGASVQTVDQIVAEIKKSGKAGDKSDDELVKIAESRRATSLWLAGIVYRPLEVLIISSACVVAAFYGAWYARAHDEGEGLAGGPTALPTMVGSAAGAVVLWSLVFALLVYPASVAGGAEHGGHDAAAANHEYGKATPHDEHAKAAPHDEHGEAASHEEHASAPKAEHTELTTAPPAWAAWFAANSTIADLLVYFGGTIVAAGVACVVPRKPLTPPSHVAAPQPVTV
jgi:hypothetical protein